MNQIAAPSGSDDDELTQSAPPQKPRVANRATSSTVAAAAKARPTGKRTTNTRSNTKANTEAKKNDPTATKSTNAGAPVRKKTRTMVKKKVTFADHEPGSDDKENLPMPGHDDNEIASEQQTKESPSKERLTSPEAPKRSDPNHEVPSPTVPSPTDNEVAFNDDKKEPLSDKDFVQISDTSTPRRPGHFHGIDDDSEDELEMLFRRSPSRPVMHKTFDSPAVVEDELLGSKDGNESAIQGPKALENDDRGWFSIPRSSSKTKDLLVSPGAIHWSSPARRLASAPAGPPIETLKGTPRRVHPLSRATSADVKVTSQSPLKKSPIKTHLKAQAHQSVETPGNTESPLRKSPMKAHIERHGNSHHMNFMNGTPSKPSSSVLLHTPARKHPSSTKPVLNHDHFNTLTPIPLKLQKVDEQDSSPKTGTGDMDENGDLDDFESSTKSKAATPLPITKSPSRSLPEESQQHELNESSSPNHTAVERGGSPSMSPLKEQEPEDHIRSPAEEENNVPRQRDSDSVNKQFVSTEMEHRSTPPRSPDNAVEHSPSREDKTPPRDSQISPPVNENIRYNGAAEDSLLTTNSSPVKQGLSVPEFRRDTISLNPTAEVIETSGRGRTSNTGFSPLVQKMHEWNVLQETPGQKSTEHFAKPASSASPSRDWNSPLVGNETKDEKPVQQPNPEAQQSASESGSVPMHEEAEERNGLGTMSSPFKEQVTHDTAEPNPVGDNPDENNHPAKVSHDEELSSDPFAISSPVGKTPSPTKPISSKASPKQALNHAIESPVKFDRPQSEPSVGSSSPLRQDSVERDLTPAPSPSPSTTAHTEYDHTLQSIEHSRLSQTGVSPFPSSVQWNSSPRNISNTASLSPEPAAMPQDKNGYQEDQEDHEAQAHDETVPESPGQSLLFSRTSLGDTRLTPFPDESEAGDTKMNAVFNIDSGDAASSPFIPLPQKQDAVQLRYGDPLASPSSKAHETADKNIKNDFEITAKETDNDDDDNYDDDEEQASQPFPSIPPNLRITRKFDNQKSTLSPVSESSPHKAAPVTPVRPAAIYPRIIHSVSTIPLRDTEENDTFTESKQSGRKRPRPQSLNAMDDHQTQKVPVRFSDSDDDDDDDAEEPRKKSRRSSTFSAPRPPTPRRLSSNSSSEGQEKTSYVQSPRRRPVKNFTSTSSEILRGAIVYTDVHTCEGADASGIFIELLTRLGAQCVKTWSWNPQASSSAAESDKDDPTNDSRMTPPKSRIGITHVVYKDGGVRTLEKVREANGLVKCVGVAWILDCEREGKWLSEDDYTVDSTIVPRGGKKRRKSMEPKRMSNVGGTLINTSPSTSENEEFPQLSPNPYSLPRKRRSSRRDSMEWVRNNQKDTVDDGDDDDNDNQTYGNDHDLEGEQQAGVFDDGITTSNKQPPTTPINHAFDFDHAGADGNSPATPYNLAVPNQQEIMQQTCPPKLQNKGGLLEKPSADGADGESGGSQVPNTAMTQTMKLQLDLAKRKSFTWKPKVGSPLARF